MAEAHQETRLAPILDWLCPYYRRDGNVEGDERALEGPGTSVLPRTGPRKVRETCYYATHMARPKNSG
jgi:hypothetical protein